MIFLVLLLLKPYHAIKPLYYPTDSLMSALWISDHTVRQWQLRKPGEVFEKSTTRFKHKFWTFLAWMIYSLVSYAPAVPTLFSMLSEFFILNRNAVQVKRANPACGCSNACTFPPRNTTSYPEYHLGGCY